MLFKILFLANLFLAAYLQTVPEAVKLTNLPNLTQDVYHGWLQSDTTTQTYLYYQLYSADNTSFNTTKNTSIPLILYLEGGPGDSGVLTAWSDFGPYGVDSNINVTGPNNPSDIKYSIYKRNNSWCGPYHLLVVDCPVFTGYSFSAKGILSNQTDTVTSHLANFLDRFYQIFSQLSSNPVHIIGHSYGGHWAPGLAYELLKNRNGMLNGTNKKINIGGILLFSPLVSEKLQVGWADFFYSAGVTDPNKRDLLKQMDFQMKYFVSMNQTVNASLTYTQEQAVFLNLIPGIQVTTDISGDNVRRNHLPGTVSSLELLVHYVSPQTFFNLSYPGVYSGRDFLNIPADVAFLQGYSTAPFVLAGDLANDYAYAVEYLLEQGVPTTILGAQDDCVIFIHTLVNMASRLNWSKRETWRNSQRKIWKYTNGTVVGNYKKYQNMNFVTLYKSGHLMTFDQPEVMNQFMQNSLFNKWA